LESKRISLIEYWALGVAGVLLPLSRFLVPIIPGFQTLRIVAYFWFPLLIFMLVILRLYSGAINSHKLVLPTMVLLAFLPSLLLNPNFLIGNGGIVASLVAAFALPALADWPKRTYFYYSYLATVAACVLLLLLSYAFKIGWASRIIEPKFGAFYSEDGVGLFSTHFMSYFALSGAAFAAVLLFLGYKRSLMAFLFTMFFTAILLGGSRFWIAGVVPFVLVGTAVRRQSRELSLLVVVAVVASLLVSFAYEKIPPVTGVGSGSLKESMMDQFLGEVGECSNRERLVLIRCTKDYYLRSDLLGILFGGSIRGAQYGIAENLKKENLDSYSRREVKRTMISGDALVYANPHNIILLFIVSTGLWGMLCIAFGVIHFLRSLVHNQRKKLFVWWYCAAVFLSPALFYPFINSVAFWVLLSLLADYDLAFFRTKEDCAEV
jgi:hypothetical protein